MKLLLTNESSTHMKPFEAGKSALKITLFRHFISQAVELKSAQFQMTAFYGVHPGH